MKTSKIAAISLVGLALALVGGVAVLRPDLLKKLVPSAKEDYGLYCDEHGVPEKFCTLCHVELKKTLLLCPEHGNIPEDICTKCHPQNAAKYDIQTCPHDLPAHFCPECHPENFRDGDTAAVGPDMIDDGYCAEFGEPPAGPEGKVKDCKLLPIVHLANAGLAATIGLKATKVVEEKHPHELTANAETAYDANRYAEIRPRVGGYVREARVDLGKKVAAGDVLAVIDSSEVSTAKTQYLAAIANLKLADDSYKRVNALVTSSAIALKEEIAARTALNQAKTSVLDAEQRLRNFRFDDADLQAIAESEDTRPILTIVSPIDGSVILRHAVLGEAVEPIANLFTVADTANFWLWIDVYERDLDRIREGQPVSFVAAGTGDTTRHDGFVTWVGAELDEKTRTTKVRAEIPNVDGTLRANQYGKVRIRIEAPHEGLTVPRSAVQRYEGADLVFLQIDAKTYRPQRIQTRTTDRRDVLEVLWGLKAGQDVVTDGSFLLKTELMKGSIGAGCCD